jgi:excisionase family DNA binding protein
MTPSPARTRPLLSVAAVAERLNVSTRSVRRSIARRDLRKHRIGGQIRVSEADLEAFMLRSRV